MDLTKKSFPTDRQNHVILHRIADTSGDTAKKESDTEEDVVKVFREYYKGDTTSSSKKSSAETSQPPKYRSRTETESDDDDHTEIYRVRRLTPPEFHHDEMSEPEHEHLPTSTARESGTRKRTKHIPIIIKTLDLSDKYSSIPNLPPIKNQDSTFECLPHSPIRCPITTCSRLISLTGLLSHVLYQHAGVVKAVECKSDQRTVLVFDPEMTPFKQNMALGLLAWTNVGERENPIPGHLCICRKNTLLFDEQEKLCRHLPILVMGCRMVWNDFMMGAPFDLHSGFKDVPRNTMLILWLVSVETAFPVKCTMTIMDRRFERGISKILTLRRLIDSQNPHEFIGMDSEYMILPHGQVKALTRNGRYDLLMELKVHGRQN